MELPQTPKNAEARANYRRFFAPGEVCFTIPKERVIGRRPSPHYHAVEDSKIFICDWQLSHPNIQLYCPMCEDNLLHHGRTNFSKNDLLFPVLEESGSTMWGVVMRYECVKCEMGFAANSGVILNSLPAHVRQAYPVDPRYAAGTFHLSIAITDNIDVVMKTYGNGNMVSKSLIQQQGKHYTRKLENYLSMNPDKSYVGFYELLGTYPPSGSDIRFLYEQAEKSEDTPTGVCNYDRYLRELQSVEELVAIAVDHTFAVVANYNLPGAKAMFTIMNSNNEIVAMVLVPTTKVEQIAHLVEQMMRRRKNFIPKILYTDTWPHNKNFWEMLLGFELQGRLGLFHIMQRIVETLNHRCDWYWKCLSDLKMCFYSYNKTDLNKLIAALKDGTLSSTERKYTDAEIECLRRSKRWKQLYDRFLRKELLPENIARLKLNNWREEYKDKIDNSDRPLFTRDTEKISKEQENKVQYIADNANFDAYREIPPGPRSKHNLSTWQSKRPEAHLENFHKSLAHFANVNMSVGLANCLTMRGAAENNVAVRHTRATAEKKLLFKKTPPLPEHVRRHPPIQDHLLMAHLNKRAKELGLEQSFYNVRPLPEDNGEVFLSDYFKEQSCRDDKKLTNEETRRCLCHVCSANEAPYLHETLVQDDDDAANTTTPTDQQTSQSPSENSPCPPSTPMTVQVAVQRQIIPACPPTPRPTPTQTASPSNQAAPQPQQVTTARPPTPTPRPTPTPTQTASPNQATQPHQVPAPPSPPTPSPTPTHTTTLPNQATQPQPVVRTFIQTRPVKASMCRCPKNIEFYKRQAMSGMRKGRPAHDKWCQLKDWEKNEKLIARLRKKQRKS